jgi:hypothetical protein
LFGLSNQSVHGVERGCLTVNSVAESKIVVAAVIMLVGGGLRDVEIRVRFGEISSGCKKK